MRRQNTGQRSKFNTTQVTHCMRHDIRALVSDSLTSLRLELDEIDDQLALCVLARAKVVRRIAALKQEHGLALRHRDEEARRLLIYTKHFVEAGEEPVAARVILEAVLGHSLAIQASILGPRNDEVGQ